MYTLPNPRYSFYEHKNFEKVKTKVTAQTNKLTDALGFYQPRTSMGLLETMGLLS
jgi:hypothetical protein